MVDVRWAGSCLLADNLKEKEDLIMKKILAVLMAAAFVFSASTVFAAKCTVEAVEGNKVTLNCDKADDVKAGDKVNVRASKKLEGC